MSTISIDGIDKTILRSLMKMRECRTWNCA